MFSASRACAEGLVVEVLVGDLDPLLDLLLPAFPFDLRLKRKGAGVLGIQIQRLLDLAQGQRVFGGLEESAGALQRLPDPRVARGLVHLPAQQSHLRIQAALSLQFGENPSAKL